MNKHHYIPSFSCFSRLHQRTAGIIAGFLLSVLMVSPTIAADTWRYVMPPGGWVTQFVPTSSGLYMLSNTRIYTSSDSGSSWTMLADIGSFIDTLIVDPTNPHDLYIGTGAGYGVMQSTDGGVTWKSIGLNKAPQQLQYIPPVTGLAFTGSVTGTIVASTNGNGMSKSTNGGQTWIAPVGQTTDQYILGMWQDPTSSQILYVITGTHGIFKSIDGGENWSAINTGIDPTLVTASNNFYGIVFDPSNHNHIFLAGYKSYSSTDGGNSWNQLTGNLPVAQASQRTFIIDPTNPKTIYAMCEVNTSDSGSVTPIWVSIDGGENWSQQQDPDNPHQGLSAYAGYIDPNNPAHILVGTDRGIFSSTDSGGTWSPSNTGFDNVIVQNFVLDKNQPGSIYASSRNNGVLKSADVGITWAQENNGILVPDIPYIGIAVGSPTKLFAAQFYGNMFVSMDQGSTWTGYNDNQNTQNSVIVAGIAVDPANSNIIYATSDIGVLKSTDGGQTWQLHTNGLPQPLPCSGCLNTITISTGIPSSLYVATTWVYIRVRMVQHPGRT